MDERPRGILILSILCIVFGVLMILGGVSVILLASKLGLSELNNTANVTSIGNKSTVLGTVSLGKNATTSLANQIKLLASIYGVLFIVPGILLVVTGVGFYKKFWWSWWLGLAIAVFAILTKINSMAAITVILAGLMIYYLTRPHIKEYFGINR